MTQNFVFGLAGAEDLKIGGGTFTVTLPDGSVVTTYHEIGSQTLLDGIRNAIQNGCVGDGSVNDRAALNTLANTTLQSAGGAIYFPSGYTFRISSNMTFPSNVALIFAANSKISMDTGVVVTINGYINCGLSQIFSGLGSVVIGGKVPEIFPQWWGALDDNSTDNVLPLQAAINASYCKSLHIPIVDTGIYRFTGPLTIDVSNLKPITIFGDGVDAFGGAPSESVNLYCIGSGNGIELIYDPAPDGALQRIAIKNLAINGDGTDATGGSGIFAKNVINLLLQNVWVSNMRGWGIYFDTCFTSKLDTVILDLNRQGGFYSKGAFNIGELDRVRCFANGRIYTAGLAGIYLDSVSGGNASVLISNLDSEGQGLNAFRMYKRSDNTLTNIVVSANVGTANTATAHNRTAGEVFIVRGATVDTDLNPGTAYTILTTPTTTSFTFATASVADGTYTESTLFIGPWVPGLVVNSATGLVVQNMFFEGGGVPCSNAIYTGPNNVSANFLGGYFQDGWIFFDLTTRGSIRGSYFTGAASGIRSSVTAFRDQIDISSDNTFASSAELTLPTVFKQDGKFWSTAPPASGAWLRGDQVLNTTPSSGGPPGWACTASGTPGTWKAMANLA